MPDKQQKQPLIDTWELEENATITIDDLVESAPFNQTQDESGESVTMGTRVPAWLSRRIAKLREFPGSPYELNSDVLRDAIWVGMQILQIRYKRHDWKTDRALSAVIDASGAMDRINAQISGLCKSLEKLKGEEDNEKAVEYLESFLITIDGLTDEWRKKTYVRILKRKGIVTELLPKCSKLAREVFIVI